MTLDELNELPEVTAATEFAKCCGSNTWIEKMVERLPFQSEAEVLAASDEAWRETTADDWLEAFSHHPRIGDREVKGWAKSEQAGVEDAGKSVEDALEQGNRDYEERFGHIYIVCASGRGPEEILNDLNSRLNNDPASELRVAASEQHRITQLRLRKLFEEQK